jgi:hypothetical protein
LVETRRYREEKARRLQRKLAILSELHPLQRELILDPSRYKVGLCGRRSGKTEMDARAIAIALEACGPEEWVIYAALTRSLAKDLIWGRLASLNERHGLGWTMRENEGLIVNSRGGKFRVFGFDKLPELEKVRGYKVRLAIFDEPATYATKLETLMRDCIGPALTDLAGTVIINGTPGAVCAGFWFEVSTGKRPRWKTWHWTVRQNPHFPRDAEEMLREEREANRWTVEEVAYRREYMAEWVNDLSALVYAYTRERNAVATLPEGYDRTTWLHTLGIDYGYHPDPCAWVVLASPPHGREIYAVHAEVHSELLPDEAAEATRRLVEHYKPSRVVGDSGGSGKAYVEEWNRRWAAETKTHVHAADKADKAGHIDLLNGELRAGRVSIVLDSCGEWADEITYLPWLDSHRRKEHPAYANHACDAALYAFMEHRSYWHAPQAPPPPPQSDRPSLEDRQRALRDAQSRDWWDK